MQELESNEQDRERVILEPHLLFQWRLLETAEGTPLINCAWCRTL